MPDETNKLRLEAEAEARSAIKMLDGVSLMSAAYPLGRVAILLTGVIANGLFDIADAIREHKDAADFNADNR